MLAEVILMLLHWAASLFGGVLLLRVYMQRLGISAHNPIAQFAYALTEWAARPLRAVIPRRGRWDWAALFGSFIVALVFLALADLVRGHSIALAWPWFVPQACLLMLRWALYIAVTLVFAYALISLINPHAPLAPTFDLLTRPMLAPIRRLIPTVGGFDLSPIVLIVAIQIVLMLIEGTGL